MAETDAEQIDFFERKIRPVLVEHCYECHSAESDIVQGGLRVDHAEAMSRGGDSGAAVTPGEPDKSLLLSAIRYDDVEMPPAGRLDAQVIKDFETWIKLGAADPREADPRDSADTVSHSPSKEIDWRQARSFWSFQPPVSHLPPSTNDQTWAQRRIDHFVLHQLEASELKPNARADRRVLIRRLSFDLTGMPPTVDDVNRFLDDQQPGAIERLVDRLLGDPQHAERWARMWLDVVRYAEDQAHKVGNNDSLTYPNAFLYRDWVIDALAADMPYDQFVRLQLAADLIDPNDKQSHIALGLLGLGPKYYRRSSPEVMADEWEDRVDTVARGLLGLTVACARCHDHKFDPIPTSDYYALAGVFAGTEMFNRPLQIEKSKTDKSSKESTAKSKKDPRNAVHIVREGKPRDLNVMIRGNVDNQGPIAKRQFLTVLSPEIRELNTGSGRGDLADAIVDRRNPLAARVIVNRVWMRLMGSPLVGTPSNFGSLGERPSHPELLDDLAVRFMQHDWSLKWLQRELVLSATYQLSSQVDTDKFAVDPENRLRWRMPRRRLSAEAYRDSLLSAAGQIDGSIGGTSIKPEAPDSNRRTVYSEVSRMGLNSMLARFDFPDPNAHSAGRYETTTPLQKLFLLNSPFLVKQAERLVDRAMQHGGSNRSQIEFVYQALFARMPRADELAWGEAFLNSADQQIRPQYMQALLISNEMFMLD